MGSSRLPGKILLPLAGRSVMAHVLERCEAIEGVDAVCLATTIEPADEVTAKTAESLGVEFFRGSENDLLDRYLRSAEVMDADVILRVTCDCPLIDPFVCAEVLRARARENADFATNNMPPSFPYGLDCEVFTRAALDMAARKAKLPSEREHVGPFIRNNPALKKVNLNSSVLLNHHYWALDTEDDRVFLDLLFKLVPIGPELWDHRELLKIIPADPVLLAASTAPTRDNPSTKSMMIGAGTVQLVAGG